MSYESDGMEPAPSRICSVKTTSGRPTPHRFVVARTSRPPVRHQDTLRSSKSKPVAPIRRRICRLSYDMPRDTLCMNLRTAPSGAVSIALRIV